MQGPNLPRRRYRSEATYRRPTRNALPVLIVVDVDPDWRIPSGSGQPFKGEFEWRGLTEGVPRMLELVRGIRDSLGRQLRFTWLLRSDDQVASLLGDGAFLADSFAEFWRQRLAKGDEIGWHPHTWRFSDRHRVWYQEQRDVDWVRACFREGHRALSRHFRIRSAKPGWMYHDATTMRMFDELGVRSTWRRFREPPFPGRFPGQVCLYGYTIGWTPLKNRTIPVRNHINGRAPAMLCACWKSRTGPSRSGGRGARIIDCMGGQIAILQTLRSIHFWSGTDLEGRPQQFPSSVPFILRSCSVARNCLAARTS